MNLETLQKKWEKDCKIGDELSDESKKIPSLHCEYITLYNEFNLMKKNTEFQLKCMMRERWEYYTGKADPKVYENEPFDFKVMKNDVDRYLYGDKKIQKLQMKIEYQSQCVFFLESVLTQIRDRQWQIRNAIEFQKLTLGYG
tara:strand:+ start:29 stop:454 length:426 start_codon:yes stop_codon:yes gene_type:complete